MEDSICRICLSPEEPCRLVSPCNCKGTQKYVHRDCHSKWRKCSPGNFLSSSYCPVCKTSFMDVTPKRKVGWSTLGLAAGMGIGVWLGSVLLFSLFTLLLIALKSGVRPKKMDVRATQTGNGLPARWRLIRTGDPVSGLRGGLILEATDQISGGVFHQSRILLVVYGYEEGAVGLILNKPAQVGGQTISIGVKTTQGPVSLQTRHFLHDNEEVKGIRLAQGLFYTPLYNPTRLGTGRMKDFYGYAGWAKAQLDGEVASGSWKLCGLVTAEDVFGAVTASA